MSMALRAAPADYFNLEFAQSVARPTISQRDRERPAPAA
jgi:hypothetical protein